MSTTERTCFSLSEVAQRAGISRSHAYRAARSGALRTVRLGGTAKPLLRVLPEDELRWLESLRTGAST